MTNRSNKSVPISDDVSQLKQRLEELEAKYEFLRSSISDIFFILSEDDECIDVICSDSTNLVQPKDVLIGNKISDMLPSEAYELYKKNHKELVENGQEQQYEYSLEIGNDLKWFSANLKLDIDGKTVLVDIRNITGRKLVELDLRKSREEYRFLAEGHNDLISKFNKDLILEYVNPNYCKTFGISKEEIIGKTFMSMIHKDDRALVKDSIISLANPPHKTDHEERVKTVKGWRWFSWSLRAQVNSNNDIINIVAVGRDITDGKKTEEALQRSEERFKMFSDLTFEGILIHEDGNIIDLNQPLLNMFGYTYEEVIGKSIFQLAVPEKYKQEITNYTQDQTVGTYEIEVVKKDGTRLPVEIVARGVNINGRELRVAAIRDMTQRKKAEMDLKDSEEKYSVLADNMNIGLVLHGADTEILYCNPTASNLLGLNQDKMTGKVAADPSWKFLKENGHPMAIEEYPVSMVMEHKKPLENYITGINNPDDNKLYWVSVNATPVFDEQNNVKYVTITFDDITLRKQAEQALKESEELFSKAFESGPLLMSVSALKDGKYIEVNKNFTRITGYSREETIGTTSTDLGFISIKNRNELRHKLLENGKVSSLEMKLTKKNGEKFSCSYFGEIVNISGKEVLLSIAEDITARKKAEQALMESENRFKALHNASFGGIAIHNKGAILECNRGLSEITGYSYEELIGMDELKLIAKETRNLVMEKISSHFEEPYEAIGIRKNGEKYPLHLEGREIPYKGMNVRVVEFRDITERKQMQIELENSERLFRTIFEHAPILIDSFDENGKCILWNEQCVKKFGWTKEEINNSNNPLELFYPDPEVRRKVIASVNTNPINEFIEWNPVNKKGDVLTILWANYATYDGGIINIGYDITERKQQEKTIRMSLQEKEVLLKELYHRTKNNMQTISSLLNLQSRRTDNEILKETFLSIQNRIRTMSLVHEKLYKSGDLTTIDLQDYVSGLSNILIMSHRLNQSKYRVKYHLDSVKFNIDYAIPLGLALNEIISNVFKHAFSGREEGLIEIILKSYDDGKIELSIIDNGVGFPAEFDPRKTKSMGMFIIFLLLEGQLKSKVSCRSDNGVCWKIEIPKHIAYDRTKVANKIS